MVPLPGQGIGRLSGAFHRPLPPPGPADACRSRPQRQRFLLLPETRGQGRRVSQPRTSHSAPPLRSPRNWRKSSPKSPAPCTSAKAPNWRTRTPAPKSASPSARASASLGSLTFSLPGAPPASGGPRKTRKKAECGMKNAATPKPHQCDIKATSMRVDSQAVATPKPP
jgi:hypothetical protein